MTSLQPASHARSGPFSLQSPAVLLPPCSLAFSFPFNANLFPAPGPLHIPFPVPGSLSHPLSHLAKSYIPFISL